MLWLAVRIVDAANRERETGDGVKVGGHQASSASLVSVMTALWFAHLEASDRVSVKPHASPVLHAINYLLGDLDRSYLTTLRARGGLQSVPEPHQGPGPGRLLHRVGGPGRRGAAVRCRHSPVRRRALRAAGPQPVRGPDGRRGARRGQRVGGHRGPRDAGPRQRDVDRRLQPAVAGPGGARRADRAVVAAVRGRRLARGDGEVRQEAAGGVRAAGRCRIAAVDRRHAERAVPGAVRARRRRRAGDVPGRRAAGRARVLPRLGRRDAGGHRRRPRRPRHRQPARRVPRVRRREGPAERRLRVHRQGLGTADRRQPAQPLGAADR